LQIGIAALYIHIFDENTHIVGHVALYAWRCTFHRSIFVCGIPCLCTSLSLCILACQLTEESKSTFLKVKRAREREERLLTFTRAYAYLRSHGPNLQLGLSEGVDMVSPRNSVHHKKRQDHISASWIEQGMRMGQCQTRPPSKIGASMDGRRISLHLRTSTGLN
jgi:hypothetical protein